MVGHINPSLVARHSTGADLWIRPGNSEPQCTDRIPASHSCCFDRYGQCCDREHLGCCYRRYFFRKKMADVVKHSKAGHRLKKDIDQEEATSSTHPKSPASTDQNSGSKDLEENIPSIASGNGQPGDKSDATMRRRHQGGMQSSQTYNEWRRPHQTGIGFFPAPWQSSGVRSAFRWPFQRLDKQPSNYEHY